MQKARIYWIASGLFLAIFAAIGYWTRPRGIHLVQGDYLLFDPAIDALHLAGGIVAIVLASLPLAGATSKRIAGVYGTIFLALGVLGFLSGTLYGYPRRLGLTLHLEFIENIAHVAVGAAGAYIATLEE